MKNVYQTKQADWNRVTTTAWFSLALLTVLFLSDCKSAVVTDWSCKPNTKLSSYWTDLNVPSVEGAVVCKDYIQDDKRGVVFLHYRTGDQTFIDFSKPYLDGFARNGWTMDTLKRTDTIWSTHVYKGRERFALIFTDNFGIDDQGRHSAKVSLSQEPAAF